MYEKKVRLNLSDNLGHTLIYGPISNPTVAGISFGGDSLIGGSKDPAKKENSISINIWDDYYEDEFIPDGEIQETYAYVEEDVDDEICHVCLSILKSYLDDIDELKENGVKVELVFYDSAEKYPNLVGTEHEYCLYKRWELRFKHLSHERRYKLVEMLSLANLEHKGN